MACPRWRSTINCCNGTSSPHRAAIACGSPRIFTTLPLRWTKSPRPYLDQRAIIVRLYYHDRTKQLQARLLCCLPYKSFPSTGLPNPSKKDISLIERFGRLVGTVVAKEKNRTRRVDKGKSGQALKTAVSGGFGGGILSQLLKQ